MRVFGAIVITIITLNFVDSAKILGVFPMPSKSHHILGESLLQGLAKAGHDVTMLSPFTSKKLYPNYKDLVVPELSALKNSLSRTMLDHHNSSMYAKMASSLQVFNLVENTLYNSTMVQKLTQDKIQYEVAIVTWFGNDAILAFAQQIANHSIIFSTVGSNPMIAKLAKVPAPTSYVPNMMPPFPDEMSFLQRLGNTITSFVFTFIMTFVNYYQRILIDKYFPNAPTVQDMYQHVSLILLNTHHSLESPRPYVPTMIQVGGLQLENSEELTGELKTFMDSAKEGVVYFSLGSNLQSSHMDEQKLRDIVKCFSKLPYKVLWKLESSNIPNLPKNVKISKWLPQKDLLAHKNMKLFITHGGLLSTTEALYHGVPMVGIPIFGDQEGNVNEGVLKGYLVRLSYADINEQSFTNAIEEVIKNPRYSENAKMRSRVFRDQPMKPMETAIYWVEYVIRHNGAHHLKTSAFKLTWYQHNLLDVYVTILAAVIVAIFLICTISKRIYKLLKNAVFSGRKIKTS